jgi:hypothetical protein
MCVVSAVCWLRLGEEEEEEEAEADGEEEEDSRVLSVVGEDLRRFNFSAASSCSRASFSSCVTVGWNTSTLLLFNVDGAIGRWLVGVRCFPRCV